MKNIQVSMTFAMMMAAVATRAQYTEIDLTSQLNSDIQTYADGNNYPIGGSQINVGGAPFGLALLNNVSGTTGIVQTPPNGVMNSYTFSVPAGTHATALYTLINTAWGEAGLNEGTVVVTGFGGETATLNLTEGFNVRDHSDGLFCNTYTDPTLVPAYFVNQVLNSTNGPVRFDRQVLMLPSSFNGDTIASITFNGIGYGEPDGLPFLVAMTLQNVPTVQTIPAVTNLFTIFAITELQGGTNDDGTITTIKEPMECTFDTKRILAFLARDKHAAGQYASTNFPACTKLVEIGGNFQVLDQTNNFLVDVSDILSIEKGSNNIVNGKIFDSTGLYDKSLTELHLLRLNYDDSGISGGAGLQFYLAGLMRGTITDTVSNKTGHTFEFDKNWVSANTNTETYCYQMDAAVGEGNYQGRPFVIMGGLAFFGNTPISTNVWNP